MITQEQMSLCTWMHMPWGDLSTAELYGLMALRQRVFVVEQDCPYLDADGWDARAHHLFRLGPDGAIDACARLFAPGVKYPEASIGRVATSLIVRRTGVGRELVGRAVELIGSMHGRPPIRISAQAYLERFYGDFGFVREGENYLEDDIPHLAMVRPGG